MSVLSILSSSSARTRARFARRSASAFLLAGMLMACAGAEELDGLESDPPDVKGVSQALNGNTIEVMKINGSQTYHTQWLGGTSWTGYNPANGPARFNTFGNGVEGSMVGSNTQWVQFGSALYHNERSSNGGQWAWDANNWSRTPGSSLGSAFTYRDVGLAEVDDGAGNTELHVCAVWGPRRLLHQIRRFGGTWTTLSDISALPLNHQSLRSVDCTRDGRDLRVFYTNNGIMHELRRFPSGTWSYQGQLPVHPNDSVGNVAAANVNGTVNLLFTGLFSNALYHRTGGANTAGGWSLVPGQDISRWGDVSAADVQGNLHVVVLKSDRFGEYHTIGTPFGWTGVFNNIFNNANTGQTPANNVTVAGSMF